MAAGPAGVRRLSLDPGPCKGRLRLLAVHVDVLAGDFAQSAPSNPINAAAVVTRRHEHLRMDVLVQFMPGPLRFALRIAEQILLIVLAGFVLSQSYFYASQMLRIGRTSDMAGIPMWIPHGSVALGFALILLIAAWRLVTVITRDADEHSAPADGEVRE